jgi:hypothetical protein
MSIGCTGCTDLSMCGGSHKLRHAYSCLDDCCGEPDSCDGMCPNNPVGFRDRMREINGLELENVPRATPCAAAALPGYIPYIYHGNRRAVPLDIEAVALPLRRFYRANGDLIFSGRSEVDATFGIRPQTRIVLIGSGRDRPIEAWWKLSERRVTLLEGFRKLGVALITGPNYSMFTDEVRYNDMHSMKRIAITWQEIVASKIPGAYHLNARTRHDYIRLSAFIAERPEVSEVAFEFKTGAAWRRRLPFHLQELSQLATHVGRPLHLVMIGGMAALPRLGAAFDRVSYIDTSAFMSAMHRKRLYLDDNNRVKRSDVLTLTGQPLDDLLADNLTTMRMRVEHVLD